MEHELDNMADLADSIAYATGCGIAKAMNTYQFQTAMAKQSREQLKAEWTAYMERFGEMQKVEPDAK